jgi:hypothetical protein
MGAEAGSSSAAVMADAQLTNVRVCKPFENFESRYQGLPTNIPIAFPGVRDPRAAQGQEGFDPDLMAGYAVPEGARVVLWFPTCFSGANFRLYSYRLVWRLRGLGDFRNPPRRQPRAPYHFPRQSPGAPDTSSATPVRTVIPASWHVIAYEEAEPATGAGELVVRVEKITPTLDSAQDFVPPKLADGADAALQQGVLDPASSGPGANMPDFVPFWTDAEGDDLIILVERKTASANVNWDFTSPTEDLPFSNIYGTGNGAHPIFRDIGIYLQTGSNP